jgi:hypothetical protein
MDYQFWKKNLYKNLACDHLAIFTTANNSEDLMNYLGKENKSNANESPQNAKNMHRNIEKHNKVGYKSLIIPCA